MNFDANRLTSIGNLHKGQSTLARACQYAVDTACAYPLHDSGKHMATRKHNASRREGTSVSCCGEWKTVAATTVSQQTTQVTDAGAKDANITCDQTKGGRHREPSKGGIARGG